MFHKLKTALFKAALFEAPLYPTILRVIFEARFYLPLLALSIKWRDSGQNCVRCNALTLVRHFIELKEWGGKSYVNFADTTRFATVPLLASSPASASALSSSAGTTSERFILQAPAKIRIHANQNWILANNKYGTRTLYLQTILVYIQGAAYVFAGRSNSIFSKTISNIKKFIHIW